MTLFCLLLLLFFFGGRGGGSYGHIETSHLTGFYMMVTLAIDELIISIKYKAVAKETYV